MIMYGYNIVLISHMVVGPMGGSGNIWLHSSGSSAVAIRNLRTFSKRMAGFFSSEIEKDQAANERTSTAHVSNLCSGV